MAHRSSRPLDLVCEGNPEMRERLAEALKQVAPYTSLENIAGDAGAIYGLVAIVEGRKPKNIPFCSIRF